MRGYRFNLEALLRHRRFIEDVRQKELAQAKEQLAQERARLQTLQRRRTTLQREMADKMSRGVAAGETGFYHRFQQHLDQKIVDQQTRVEAAIEQRNHQRAALTEAMQHKKMMEKLKAKGLQQFRQKLIRQERADMDEASVLRFARKNLKQT